MSQPLSLLGQSLFKGPKALLYFDHFWMHEYIHNANIFCNRQKLKATLDKAISLDYLRTSYRHLQGLASYLYRNLYNDW